MRVIDLVMRAYLLITIRVLELLVRMMDVLIIGMVLVIKDMGQIFNVIDPVIE